METWGKQMSSDLWGGGQVVAENPFSGRASKVFDNYPAWYEDIGCERSNGKKCVECPFDWCVILETAVGVPHKLSL